MSSKSEISPTPTPTSRGRVTELDALRGLAVLVVVAYHYLHEFPIRYGASSSAIRIADFGKYGVHLFFMISGFVIYMTVERSRRPADFAIGRFSRLFPAYWVASLITFLVLFASPLPDIYLRPVDFVVNLSMIEGFLLRPYIDGAYWSLTIELSFYLVVFCLLMIRRTAWTLGVLWALVSIYVVGRFGWNRGYRGRFMGLLFDGTTLLSYAHLFAAGIVFYLIIVQQRRSVGLYVQLALVPVIDALANGVESAIVIAIAMSIMAIALLARPAFLRARSMLFLGVISYSLYLTHQRIGYVMMRYLDRHGVNHWAGLVITTGAVVGVATILQRFVERPAQLALRRRFAQLRTARPRRSSGSDDPTRSRSGNDTARRAERLPRSSPGLPCRQPNLKAPPDR